MSIFSRTRVPQWIAALCLLVTVPVEAQVQFAPDQLRDAAVVALREGDAKNARRFGEALIARDGKDLNAHLIVARAARDMGDIRPARAAARKAWKLAETDAQRYSAALITAQVLATDGKRTRAQLWLRRAAQNAPNDALRARAQRDFGYVKQNNRWRTDLAFTFAPNSNINNASNTDRGFIYLEDIPFPLEYNLDVAEQAIAGLEVGATVRTRYRFLQTPTTAHDAKISLAYKTYSITDDLGASDVKGRDFAFGYLALGYGYRQLNTDRRGEFSFDTEVGQTWYGGNRYATYFRLQGQQSLIVEGNRRLRFGGNLERQWGQATPDVDTAGVSASLTQAFSNGNSGYLNLSARATQSDNANSEYNEVTLRTGLALRKPVMGAAVQFGLGYSWRDYDVSINSRDGRQDNRLFADVTATFKDVDYYGFNPTVTLTASRTDSNVALYDVSRVGLNIGIRSAF